MQTVVHSSKYIKKEIEKRIYNLFWNGKKYDLTGTYPTLLFEGWICFFRHRHSLKLSKNKMDSKVVKSHQCSLEISHAVLIDLNSEF